MHAKGVKLHDCDELNRTKKMNYLSKILLYKQFIKLQHPAQIPEINGKMYSVPFSNSDHAFLYDVHEDGSHHGMFHAFLQIHHSTCLSEDPHQNICFGDHIYH